MTNWLPSVKILGTIQADLAAHADLRINHILAVDKKEMDSDEDAISRSVAKLKQDQKAYEPMISSDEERKLYEQYQALPDAYMKVHLRVLDLSRQGKKAEARDLTFAEAPA